MKLWGSRLKENGVKFMLDTEVIGLNKKGKKLKVSL